MSERNLGKYINAELLEELNQTFSLGKKKYKTKLATELYFDPAHLHRYNGQQPRQFASYVFLLAQSRMRRSRAEIKIQQLEQRLRPKAINELKASGLSRPSKVAIQSHLLNKSPKYKKYYSTLEKYDVQVEVLEGIVKAFEQRSKLMVDAFYYRNKEE